jgi:hypothetical protein
MSRIDNQKICSEIRLYIIQSNALCAKFIGGTRDRCVIICVVDVAQLTWRQSTTSVLRGLQSSASSWRFLNIWVALSSAGSLDHWITLRRRWPPDPLTPANGHHTNRIETFRVLVTAWFVLGAQWTDQWVNHSYLMAAAVCMRCLQSVDRWSDVAASGDFRVSILRTDERPEPLPLFLSSAIQSPMIVNSPYCWQREKSSDVAACHRQRTKWR